MTGGWGGGSRDGAARSENHAKGVDIIMSQTCISSLRRSVYHHSAGVYIITPQECISSLRRSVYHHSAGVYIIDSEGIASHHSAGVHNQDTLYQLIWSKLSATFAPNRHRSLDVWTTSLSKHKIVLAQPRAMRSAAPLGLLAVKRRVSSVEDR